FEGSVFFHDALASACDAAAWAAAPTPEAITAGAEAGRPRLEQLFEQFLSRRYPFDIVSTWEGQSGERYQLAISPQHCYDFDRCHSGTSEDSVAYRGAWRDNAVPSAATAAARSASQAYGAFLCGKPAWGEHEDVEDRIMAAGAAYAAAAG